MASFKLYATIESGEVHQSALIGTAAQGIVDNDIGKLVKLAAADNFILCSTGDEIEGQISALQPETYNSGFAFGSVKRGGTLEAMVSSDQVGALAPGDLVVAGVQAAVGTKDTYPKVKGGSPTNFKWRVLTIQSGTGVAGDRVLLEKI